MKHLSFWTLFNPEHIVNCMNFICFFPLIGKLKVLEKLELVFSIFNFKIHKIPKFPLILYFLFDPLILYIFLYLISVNQLTCKINL